MSATGLTVPRIVMALAIGALVGGVATLGVFAASAYIFGEAAPGLATGFTPGLVLAWATLALISVLGWLTGLVVIGGPAWILLHRLGLTSRLHAMLLGALAAGAAGYVAGILARAPHPIAWFIAFAIVGMGVGFLVRKIAYRTR